MLPLSHPEPDLFADLQIGRSALTSFLSRHNPAVLAAAATVFVNMCQALGADSLQGQTAQRVAAAAKSLAQTAGLNAEALLGTLVPERQQNVRTFFS